MTHKQERFVQEYLIDLNASQAAIRAGYGPDSAELTGSRLLRNVKVQEAIQQVKKLLGERAQIKADQVIEEFRRIAFASIGDVVTTNSKGELAIRPLSEIPPETLAGVDKIFFEEITNKRGEVRRTLHVRMGLKLRALTKLGEHLGFVN